jgi:hypothetical protein
MKPPHKAIKGAHGYSDLADLQEDDRIRVIGNRVMQLDITASVVTDDTPGKIERYMQKIAVWFPLTEVVEQGTGPTDHAVYFKVRKKPN